jgi:hypothetical protein
MDLWIGNFRHLPNRPENIMSLSCYIVIVDDVTKPNTAYTDQI